jgi:MinD superfamily P-loop ATPase
MRTGGGRAAGRGMGQGGGQSVGRGAFGLVSLGLGWLSDVITPRQNRRARQTTSDASRANRLVAAVIMAKCCSCGICQQICFQGAIVQGQLLRIDASRCTGCGQCVMECPEEALVLKRGRI